jgi:hypothetical protein
MQSAAFLKASVTIGHPLFDFTAPDVDALYCWTEYTQLLLQLSIPREWLY